MSDRPILFSGPMVRALLDGSKTQTRRVLKMPRQSSLRGDWEASTVGGHGATFSDGSPAPERVCVWHTDTGYTMLPPINVDDRLWVRETALYWMEGKDYTPCKVAAFAVDGYELEPFEKWVPSIFMPRWASRLTLTVTDVRVQRLQDISDEDARAEGCDASLGLTLTTENGANPGNPRRCFEMLWDSLNAKRGFGWDANPWVAAYTFTVDRRNIDEVAHD